MKQIYICNDTITGIFSAIYEAWKEYRDEEAGIAIRGHVTPQLFCEYHETEETEEKSMAVARLIKENLGHAVYGSIYHALLSEDAQKAEAVYQMMLAARTLQNGTKIMEHLSHPYVGKVFELSRKVSNEVHFFLGFVRFRELENGVLLSEITPKSRVLTCIGDYFTDRLPIENWMIYDKSHKEFLVHMMGRKWILVQGEELSLQETYKNSVSQGEFEQLWKGFCHSISIKERENTALQRNHVPMRFRQNITEFC